MGVLWIVAALLPLLAGLGGPGDGLATVAAAPLAAPDNSITLVPFLSGLSSPIFLTHANDATGRLFVVEQGGQIKVVANGVVQPTPFLDLSSLVVAGGEQGLLGLAFHPRYPINGRFFVFYTAKPPPGAGNNTVVEYRVSSGNPNIADPSPVRTLLSIADRYTNHNGGMLAFGQDGYLYIGTGDEGSGGDPEENAQNLNSLFGKLLRVDVDNGGNPFPPGFTYAIPPGNPFAGQAGVRPEIWAYGFRNPWRWSFDRVTGDLLIGDVGQGVWEEVDVIPRGQGGGNYGWDDREGAHCYEPSTGCLTANRIDPILEYSHAANAGPCASITGGYRYRGSAYPALAGAYFYADYCTGRIWKGLSFGGGWTAVEALDTTHNISSFGEDQAGELYVLTAGGSVFRLTPAGQPSCAPRPRVTLQSVQTAPGTLTVTLSATNNTSIANNTLQAVEVFRLANASASLGSQSNQTAPFTVTLPGGTTSTQLVVRRVQAGQAFTANLRVTDGCGPWTTFVGGGPNVP
ncbi:MAG: PQQ-dependent sugar dehydrogenase [Chloroflexi bacterium]|nr:PQQ-dependent sugar dehydrogenase [Chloroflexota bacterium]